MTATRSRVTITGVDGFVGRHLARLAVAAGHDVTGIVRAEQGGAVASELGIEHRAGDLTEGWPEDALGDVVVHLAGRAAVGPSFDAPQLYLNDNSSMVTHLFEAILRRPSEERPRVVVVSSGAVYRAPENALPRDEDAPIGHSSPYVVSKLLVEHQVRYYRERGVDAVIARPFNHIGPGQSRGFVVPDLAESLRLLPEGEPLLVGDLTTRRDYTDVRDVADAYLRLATASELRHAVYNIASGRSLAGTELLSMLCEVMGREVPELRVDERRVRATDARDIVGRSQRLSDELGWRPAISVQRSIEDFVAAGGI